MKRLRKSLLKKKRYIVAMALVVVAGVLYGVSELNQRENEEWPIKTTMKEVTDDTGIIQGYGVSTSNLQATQVGMAVLEKGGNAMDAAIAISYMLGTVNPDTSGIGGGGGMLVYDLKTDSYTFFDYLSAAPTYSGSSATCVPGFVLGMETAWQTFGSLPMSELIQPSVDCAENGFIISSIYAGIFNANAGKSRPYLTFSPGPTYLTGGELLIQPQLAQTMRAIQQKGSVAFYSGEIAGQVCAQTGWTKDDLASYRVNTTNPVQGSFAGYQIVAAPPPFSGITLIQMLKGFALSDIPKPTEDETSYLAQLKRFSDLTHADRIRRIADPNYFKTSYAECTTTAYVKSMLSLPDTDYDETQDEEHESTTHFVVVDKQGMIVSCTNTLSQFFGTGVNVAGFYLNSSGNNFGSSSGNNAFQQGKRPRTFMAPTIIQGPDGFQMGIGTPGGNRIIRVLAPVIWDTVIWKTDAQEAVNKNRIVFSGTNTMTLENSPFRKNVLSKSHPEYYTLPKNNDRYFGSIQAMGYSPERGGVFGAADPRRESSVSIVNLAPPE